MGPQENLLEVEGRVELAARDLDGSVLAVGIRGANGLFHLVDDTRKGNELLVYIGSKVRASGMNRREDGQLILRVADYLVF